MECKLTRDEECLDTFFGGKVDANIILKLKKAYIGRLRLEDWCTINNTRFSTLLAKKWKPAICT